MKLNFINEAKLSTAQIRDVDNLIRGLQNFKKGDFKKVHRGYGNYQTIGRVISGLQGELYAARPLETYAIPPVISRLIEKYPKSIKAFQNHFTILDPSTGKPKQFDYDDLRHEKRNQEETGDKGKSKTEIEIISLLRNRRGYQTLQNYINYLKKLGFSGTKGLDLTKLRFKMEHITLEVRSKDRMLAWYEPKPLGPPSSFKIDTNGEVLKVEELIDTINEVQLAAKTLGVDIDSAWISEADGGVLYTLVTVDSHENRSYVGHRLARENTTLDIDSENIESVQDAYREIKKAMGPQEEDDQISNLSDRSVDRLDHTLANAGQE